MCAAVRPSVTDRIFFQIVNKTVDLVSSIWNTKDLNLIIAEDRWRIRASGRTLRPVGSEFKNAFGMVTCTFVVCDKLKDSKQITQKKPRHFTLPLDRKPSFGAFTQQSVYISYKQYERWKIYTIENTFVYKTMYQC